MAVLRKINPDLQAAVARASCSLKRIQSVTKPWFGSGSWPLFEMDIKDCIKDAGGRTEQELIINNQVMAYTIMRSTLQVRIPPPSFFAHTCILQTIYRITYNFVILGGAI